jgi:O-antigen/teichoic acid export membrane protein
MTQVLRLASNLLLARLLVPADFGLVAIVTVIQAAVEMFSDIGLGPAIINSPRADDQRFLNTAFTIQFLRGAAVMLVMTALAWPVSRLYGQRELLLMLPVAGMLTVVAGLASPALLLASRRLDQRTLTIIDVAGFAIQIVTTLVCALLLRSAWSFIVGWLFGAIAKTLMSHIWLGQWKDRFEYDRDAAGELFRLGRWIFISTIVTFLAMQSDRLILGRLVSMELLGVYSLASMLCRLPSEVVLRLANRVQYPALAETLRVDPSGTESELLTSRRLLLTVAQFGTVGLIVMAPCFFVFLYNERYAEASAFAPLLAMAAWPALLQASADRALLAIGNARSIAVSNAVNAAVTIPACIGGHAAAGMPGFMCGVGAGNLAGHLVIWWSLRRRYIHIGRQDAAYTALVGAVAVASLLTSSAPGDAPGSLSLRLTVGGAGLILSFACVLRAAWPFVKKLVPGRFPQRPLQAVVAPACDKATTD